MNFWSTISVGGLYIDPATTSYLVQIIVGGVIAIGAAAGIFFNKIKRLFKKDTKSKNVASSQKDEGKIITADDLLDDEE